MQQQQQSTHKHTHWNIVRLKYGSVPVTRFQRRHIHWMLTAMYGSGSFRWHWGFHCHGKTFTSKMMHAHHTHTNTNTFHPTNWILNHTQHSIFSLSAICCFALLALLVGSSLLHPNLHEVFFCSGFSLFYSGLHDLRYWWIFCFSSVTNTRSVVVRLHQMCKAMVSKMNFLVCELISFFVYVHNVQNFHHTLAFRIGTRLK